MTSKPSFTVMRGRVGRGVTPVGFDAKKMAVVAPDASSEFLGRAWKYFEKSLEGSGLKRFVSSE